MKAVRYRQAFIRAFSTAPDSFSVDFPALLWGLLPLTVSLALNYFASFETEAGLKAETAKFKSRAGKELAHSLSLLLPLSITTARCSLSLTG